jgi:hypothetical protein
MNFCLILIVFIIYLIVFLLISKIIRNQTNDNILFERYYNFKNNSNIYGGEFNIMDFLSGLRKKYTSSDDHIEIELKLKHSHLFDKIAKYIRQHKNFEESKTENHIWQNGIIKTINSDGSVNWSIKKRLSNYNFPIGKITIALEKDTNNRETSNPMLIRKKNRISAPLDSHWRIDYTEVKSNDGNINNISNNHNDIDKTEVEFEYIANDYWNAPNHLNEIEEFLEKI